MKTLSALLFAATLLAPTARADASSAYAAETVSSVTTITRNVVSLTPLVFPFGAGIHYERLLRPKMSATGALSAGRLSFGVQYKNTQIGANYSRMSAETGLRFYTKDYFKGLYAGPTLRYRGWRYYDAFENPLAGTSRELGAGGVAVLGMAGGRVTAPSGFTWDAGLGIGPQVATRTKVVKYDLFGNTTQEVSSWDGVKVALAAKTTFGWTF